LRSNIEETQKTQKIYVIVAFDCESILSFSRVTMEAELSNGGRYITSVSVGTPLGTTSVTAL